MRVCFIFRTVLASRKIMNIMWSAVISFILGIFLTLVSFRLLMKRRLVFASINGIAGLTFLSTSLIFFLLLLNLYTYHVLTSEIPIARVEIGILTDKGTDIILTTPDERRTLRIDAKEWQLDARFLKWKAWANLLGKEPLVRLESFYERIPNKTGAIPSRIDLVGDSNFLVDLGGALSEWLGMIDTYYGSSVYMPVKPGAVYNVTASVSGLVVRADNRNAQQAVSEWMIH